MALYTINMSPHFFKYCGVHTHEWHELILNLEGEGIMTIGNKQFPFFPGSVHIVPQNTPHIKESKDKFRDIYFLTDTLFPIQPTQLNAEAIITFSDDTDRTLEKLMQMMLYRYLQGNKNDTVLESMYELALKIVEESCIKVQKDPVVEKIIQKLTSCFNDPDISVSEILHTMGYSKDHLRRKFVCEVGVTPSEYLTSLRISQAKKMLKRQRELGIPISEIGALCGYYDARYFSRIFKKETGLSPQEYAKKHFGQY